MSTHKAETTHSGDLRYICITQNVGAIDPSQPGMTIADMRMMVDRFVNSMSAFLRSIATDMNIKASGRGGGRSGAESTGAVVPEGSETTRKGSCCVAEFDVVVLHMQEIGGKKRNEDLMTILEEAVPRIFSNAGWCSGLLMTKENCNESFTAMGTVIFVSKRITPITSILSFRRNNTFVALTDDPISYVATDGSVSEDLLFAGKKFSEAGTSRKGYMLSSIRIGTQRLNFINSHMFHDEDNRIAVKSTPSEYAIKRRRAWSELITEVLPLIDLTDPCFIFGDLNTRLDAVKLLEFARNNFTLAPISAKKSIEKNADFWDFVVEPKNIAELLKYDCEMSTLLNIAGQHGMELGEFLVQFPPTFTKEVGPDDQDEAITPGMARMYSQMLPNGTYALERVNRPNKNERFPAFCDRIVLNPSGLKLVRGEYASAVTTSNRPDVWKLYQYNSTVIDSTDHDGVYLAF